MNQAAPPPEKGSLIVFVVAATILWFLWWMVALELFDIPNIWAPHAWKVVLAASIPYLFLVRAAWQERNRISVLDPDDQISIWVGKAATPLNLVAMGIALYGIGLWGYQIIFWLKTSEWVPCSLYHVVTYGWGVDTGPISWIPRGWGSKKFIEWLAYPNNWVGLHTIVLNLLEWTPVSLVAVILGGWIEYLYMEFDQGRRKAEAKLLEITAPKKL